MEITQVTLPAKDIDDHYIMFVAGRPFLIAAFKDQYGHRKFFLASMDNDVEQYNIQMSIPSDVPVQAWHIQDLSQGLHGV